MVILWIINVILIIAIIFYSLKYDIEKMKFLVWRRDHYRSWLLVRLFMGAGMLWVFGATYRIPIFASLFSLQGVLIFLVMVIYRYYAKRRLGGQKCWCFTFPENWQKVPEIDEDEIRRDRELEPQTEGEFILMLDLELADNP